MKKFIQLLVVLVLVLTVVGITKNSPVWARSLPASLKSVIKPVVAAEPVADVSADKANSPLATLITVTETGNYNVGGVCTMDIAFTATGLQDKVDAEVSVEDSKKVPFSDPGKLFYPGCHVVHYKADQIVREMNPADGSWKVCFGANPDMRMKIYYYLDTPARGTPTWIGLPTTLENNGLLACAPALYTGVYMPSGKTIANPGGGEGGAVLFPGMTPGGSVRPPAPDITVHQSGTYAVGGICAIIIQYNVDGLKDNIHVQYPTEDTKIIPFPDEQGLLYFPGCHVLHYQNDNIKPEMTATEGSWKICFADRPGKTMTIYYYKDDLTAITQPWIPLVTTVENGLACAPLVNFSAVYAPAGK